MKFRRRNISNCRLWFCVAFTVVALGLGVSGRAAFMIQLTQSGANVIATGNGTPDLASLTSAGTTTDSGFVSPALGFLGVGSPATSSITFYSLLTGPISFGTGGTANSTTGTGSEVIIAGRYEEFGVPASYISGNLLSDSATFYGSFDSLGITPGTYSWNWGTGASADSLTVTAATVPEPASVGLTSVLPALVSIRRRSRCCR